MLLILVVVQCLRVEEFYCTIETDLSEYCNRNNCNYK